MKFQNIIKIGLLVGFAFNISGCTTLPGLENAWRTQSYLSDDMTNVDEIQRTLNEILSIDDVDKNVSFFAMNIDMKKNNYKGLRNTSQDYLKAVSNQNCNRFKTQALAAQANTNFALGGIATTLGTVGSLLSPASTAQALSGASAAVTGIQSQVGENYYREKTFEIISRAINVRRKAIWANIEEKRSNQSDSYTINHALADVIEYNNACSIVVGFEELADSVSTKEDQVEKAIGKQKQDPASRKLTVEQIIAK